MGIMDQVREETRPAGLGSTFLSADERHGLVDTRQPFNIVAMRRGAGSPKIGGKLQWYVDVEFLDAQGETYTIQDQETGEMVPIRRCLTFNVSENRDKEFPVLEKLRAEKGGILGPLMLTRVNVQGQPNPAYIFADYDTGAPQAVPAGPPPTQNLQQPGSVPPAPAASGRLRSPDGLYEYDGTNWVPTAAEPVPPPPPPDVIPAASLPGFSGATEGQARTSVATPTPGKSQPLPEVADVATGGDGEGGTVSVTRYKGDQVRQAIYREDGVVQTPQGGLVQMASPEPPKPLAGAQIVSPDGKHVLQDGKWIALPPLPGADVPEAPELAPALVSAEDARREAAVQTGGIAQEASNQRPATQAQEPVQATATTVPEAQIPANEKPKRTTIPMQAKCDSCGKQVKGSSFKDSKGRWILTHTCDAADPSRPGQKIGSKKIDVNDAVLSIIAEAANA